MIAEYTAGSTGFDVDGEGDEVASEGLDDLFGDRLTGSILRLAGRGTEMRVVTMPGTPMRGDSVVGSSSNTSMAAPAI